MLAIEERGVGYQVMPPLSDEEYEALKADIAKIGVRVPVEYDDQGNILDGHHRVQICRELGIADWPRIVRRDLSEEEKRPYARRLNLARRQLNQEQKRAQIAAQLRETPHLSDRRIAKELGTSHPTVAAVRDGLMRQGEVERFATSQGADGKWYPRLVERETPHPESVSQLAAECGRMEEEASEPPIPHVARNSGDNEWYTPAEYIDAARRVMGGIDLDPASHETANEVVGAATFFTAEDDGLGKEWAGRVFLNPPYAPPLIGQFCEKLVASFTFGTVREAIVLVNNATETRWFQALASRASAICFPAGRVHFWAPDKISSTPLQGQAVIYMGKHVEKFEESFGGFGFVASLR